jgi:hypothetical protein
MNCPATTAAPDNVRLPAAGSVETFTAASACAAAGSAGSVSPKSATAKVYDPSSSAVTVRSVPAGASLTGVTFTVNVFADGSRSAPPFAVPPSSRTWKVKLA